MHSYPYHSKGTFKLNIVEKLQTVIILIAVGTGLLLGQLSLVEQHAEMFIIPFLLLMLYGLFLTIPNNRVEKCIQKYNIFEYEYCP